MMKLKYFTEQEINKVSFGCDDGFNRMNPFVLQKMDKTREIAGIPIILTCAFRTIEHDQTKGRSGKSDHCKGCGFDTKVKDMKHMLYIVACATLAGFNTFGYNQEEGFLHVGFRKNAKKVITWNY